MAAKTFWFYDAAVNKYGKLDEGSAPGSANTGAIASYQLGVEFGGSLQAIDELFYDTNISLSDGDASNAVAPHYGGANLDGNGLRSLGTLHGTFAAGTWSFTAELINDAPYSDISNSLRFRIYKSSNADGSSSTELTSGVVATSAHGTSSSAYTVSGTTSSLSGVTFADEYLFVTLAWAITDAGIDGGFADTGTITLRVGGTKLVTPNFSSIFNVTLSESGSASDSYGSAWIGSVVLTETPALSWGAELGAWGGITGVWGGATSEFFDYRPFNVGRSLSELVSAGDSTSCVIVMNGPFVSEAVTAQDSLQAGFRIDVTLLETPSEQWGTAGIEWGSAGVWGGSTADTFDVSLSIPVSLTEAENAVDSLASQMVFANLLTESRSAIDSSISVLVAVASLSEIGTATDSVVSATLYSMAITESLAELWGTLNTAWGCAGVWGGGTADTFVSAQIFRNDLLESGAATDTEIGLVDFFSSVNEIGIALDVLNPNLVIEKSLSESSTPLDTMSAVATYQNSLIEIADLLWGVPGMLWDLTTGVYSGESADSLVVSAAYNNSMIEAGSASDSSLGVTLISLSLLEVASSLDLYGSKLDASTSISEIASALDSLVAGQSFFCILTEFAAALWGTPNVPWGVSVWGVGALDVLNTQQVFDCRLNELPVYSIHLWGSLGSSWSQGSWGSDGAVDFYNATMVFNSSLPESANASDSIIPNLVISQTLLEVSGPVDSLSTTQIFQNLILEIGSARDSIQFSLIGSASSQIIPIDVPIFGLTQIEDPLGVDLFSFDDYDSLGTLVFGFEALGQRLARRLSNPRGAWFWAPNECTDIRNYLNEIITNETISTLKTAIEREALREEAVKTVEASVKYESNVLTVNLIGTTRSGPFEFVFKVTSLKLTLVR